MIRETLDALGFYAVELLRVFAEEFYKRPSRTVMIVAGISLLVWLLWRIRSLKRANAALSVQSGNNHAKLTDAERTGLAVRLAPLAPPPSLAPAPKTTTGCLPWVIIGLIALGIALAAYWARTRDIHIVPAAQRVVTVTPPAVATSGRTVLIPAPSALPPPVATARPVSPPAPPMACGAGQDGLVMADRFLMRRQFRQGEPPAPAASLWRPFKTQEAGDAALYYEHERATIIREKGVASAEAAYNANNLAVALAYIGRCAEAENLFASARALALGLPLAPADREAIDRNYARFRAMKTAP